MNGSTHKSAKALQDTVNRMRRIRSGKSVHANAALYDIAFDISRELSDDEEAQAAIAWHLSQLANVIPASR